MQTASATEVRGQSGSRPPLGLWGRGTLLRLEFDALSLTLNLSQFPNLQHFKWNF